MSLTPSAKNTGQSCNGFLVKLVDQGCLCDEGSLLFQIMKRTVYPKLKIMSSVNHPQVVPNLYEFLSSVEHTQKKLKNVGNQPVTCSQ